MCVYDLKYLQTGMRCVRFAICIDLQAWTQKTLKEKYISSTQNNHQPSIVYAKEPKKIMKFYGLCFCLTNKKFEKKISDFQL